MKKILILIILLLSNSGLFNVFPGNQRYPVIPKPVRLVEVEGEFLINKKTSVTIDDLSCQGMYVVNALNNAISETGGFNLINKQESGRNCVTIKKDQTINHKEGYVLTINKKGISIGYKNLHGAFNAVQTIRQLMPVVPVKGVISIPCVEIEDAPMLEYRGYMLDVARHFFPMSHLKKTIDMLAFYKINVFHIHLTDDQGWRIEIKKHPKLHEIGAWRNETQNGHRTDVPTTFDGIPHGGYYTQNELKELINYAQERFIRVIPEIDIPGHTQAVLAAYPQYGCVDDTTYTVSTKWGYHDDILCPKEETFSFLQDIFDEVMTVFPDKYIHIGGDEVQKRCWKESVFCQDMIKRLDLKDEKGLQSYFIHRIESYLNAEGREIIGWDEILEGGLAPNATVMSWRGEKGGIEAAKSKHNVIMTPSAFMYLNFYNTPFKDKLEPLANTHVLPLEKVYNYSPFPKVLSDEEKKHIIGLQASVWTEYCKTIENAESLTYPRLCAMAECAWTPMEQKNYDDFYNRLVYNIGHLDKWKVNYSKLFLNNK
ncbi:MAG: beta-N-acetylhexosaminidase [Paludibacter sp.]|nr:beta-N-acetylhexosaminidase [Paludibacter sp.]